MKDILTLFNTKHMCHYASLLFWYIKLWLESQTSAVVREGCTGKDSGSRREFSREASQESLEERRKNALLKIEEVADMMQRTRNSQSQRLRLARVLDSVNDEVLPGLSQGDVDDQLISPSTRTMAWWQRLNNSFKRRQELHRQIRSSVEKDYKSGF